MDNISIKYDLAAKLLGNMAQKLTHSVSLKKKIDAYVLSFPPHQSPSSTDIIRYFGFSLENIFNGMIMAKISLNNENDAQYYIVQDPFDAVELTIKLKPISMGDNYLEYVISGEFMLYKQIEIDIKDDIKPSKLVFITECSILEKPYQPIVKFGKFEYVRIDQPIILHLHFQKSPPKEITIKLIVLNISVHLYFPYPQLFHLVDF